MAMFWWEKGWHARAVAALVTAALMGGIGASSARAEHVRTVRTATAVSAAAGGHTGRESVSVLGLRGGAPLAVGSSAVPGGAVVKKKPGIKEILQLIGKYLGMTYNWIKAQVLRGYGWFKTAIWDKLPAPVRFILGGSAWEIWSALFEYLF